MKQKLVSLHGYSSRVRSVCWGSLPAAATQSQCGYRDVAGLSWHEEAENSHIILLGTHPWPRKAQGSASNTQKSARKQHCWRRFQTQKASMDTQVHLQLARNAASHFIGTVEKPLFLYKRKALKASKIFMVISVVFRSGSKCSVFNHCPWRHHNCSRLPHMESPGQVLPVHDSTQAVCALLCLGNWHRNSASSPASSLLFHLTPHKTTVLTPNGHFLSFINGICTLQRVWSDSLEFLHQFLYFWGVGRSRVYRQSSPLWEYCYRSL